MNIRFRKFHSHSTGVLQFSVATYCSKFVFRARPTLHCSSDQFSGRNDINNIGQLYVTRHQNLEKCVYKFGFDILRTGLFLIDTPPPLVDDFGKIHVLDFPEQMILDNSGRIFSGIDDLRAQRENFEVFKGGTLQKSPNFDLKIVIYQGNLSLINDF